MHTVRVLAIASLGVVVGRQPLFAQSLSRYRAYALDSSVSPIVKISGAREADLKSLHVRREYQLVPVSRELSAKARTAIREAVRLDVRETPQLAIDQRTKDAADERAAQGMARAANKAGFRP